jgi:hypothetical protein
MGYAPSCFCSSPTGNFINENPLYILMLCSFFFIGACSSSGDLSLAIFVRLSALVR